MISLIIHIMFLMQYWIPETSDFPGSSWWMTQLGPLASPWLVTGGEQIIPTQSYADPAAFILLVSGIVLVCLSRTGAGGAGLPSCYLRLSGCSPAWASWSACCPPAATGHQR